MIEVENDRIKSFSLYKNIGNTMKKRFISKEEDRKIIQLYGDSSIIKIAEILNLPYSTIVNRIYRYFKFQNTCTIHIDYNKKCDVCKKNLGLWRSKCLQKIDTMNYRNNMTDEIFQYILEYAHSDETLKQIAKRFDISYITLVSSLKNKCSVVKCNEHLRYTKNCVECNNSLILFRNNIRDYLDTKTREFVRPKKFSQFSSNNYSDCFRHVKKSIEYNVRFLTNDEIQDLIEILKSKIKIN
jgi:predicted DNA-binding protein YlxM (UPF0122 family)